MEASATAAAGESLRRVLGVIGLARAGDLATVRMIIDAARAHPEAFPEGFADRLSEATGEALVEAGVVLAELIEVA